MSEPKKIDVLVSEVGQRDGLQSIKRTMPTEAKFRWIEALGAWGNRSGLLRVTATAAANGRLFNAGKRGKQI